MKALSSWNGRMEQDSGEGEYAARLANMRLGDNQHKKEGVQICTPSISLEQAAEMLSVSPRLVALAR